jgi:hypothetical protein
MFARTTCFTLAIVLGLLGQSLAADSKTSLTNLSLEVTALQTLHRFQLTPAQLEAIRKVARDTMSSESRESGKGSSKLRQTFTDLRTALIRGDQERIDTLHQKLDDLLDADDTDLDDEVVITAGARQRVNEVLSFLKPAQVGAFLNDPGEDLPDPLEKLLTALNGAGKLKDDEWKSLCEDTIKTVGWQLGGLEVERARVVEKRVESYLNHIRSLKESERKAQHTELEKSAQEFVARVPPTQILHHFTQRALAEMLSNPRLVAAVEARLKK